MANTVSPRGFTPVKLDHHDVHRYYKSAAGVLTIGDPVVRSTASNDPLGYGTVIRASTGSAITGVVVGFEIDANRTYDYLASADVGYVMVADNPFQEFYVQDNGGAAGIPITALGTQINSCTALDGNTTIARSKYTLDTQAQSSGDTWQLVRLSDRPNNVVGANAEWVVKANLHTERNASTTNITAI